MPYPRQLPATGTCRCGRVRLRVTKPAMLSMACHCHGCQKMTGSAFSLSLAMPADGVEVLEGELVRGGLQGEHDMFKTYNDSYGHDVGDAVLKQVANAVKGALRAQDIVARTGGDEFLVICPDTGLDAALACAERVRFAVESAPLLLGGQSISMSVSIGVATRDTVMSEPEALIKRADQALYLAKNKGRNRIMTAQSLRPGPLVPPR